MAQNELIEVMQSRANMYNMLSRAFVEEADADFIREMKHAKFPQNTGNADIDAAYLALYKYLRSTPESVLDDLAVDYARIFLGAGDMEARAAYPFESVYTSERGLLMQAARDEVLAIYKSEGLAEALPNRHNEGEDHLALELMFMREMALRTKAALEAGNEDAAVRTLLTQRNFLIDHPMRWVGKWSKDVPKYEKTTFYGAFAALTWAYIREDRTLLEELVGADEGPAATAAEQED